MKRGGGGDEYTRSRATPAGLGARERLRTTQRDGPRGARIPRAPRSTRAARPASCSPPTRRASAGATF